MKSDKYTWGSHIPLHKAIFEAFKPKSSVEVGAGIHSTKLFFESVDKALSIETDKKWIEKVSANLELDDNHSIYHLNLDEYLKDFKQSRSVNASELPITYFDEAKNQLNSQIKSFKDHLFIDTLRSLRSMILEEYHSNFKVVTFHDVNKKGLINHWKSGEMDIDPKYKMFIDKTYPVYTGLLIKNTYVKKLDSLKSKHSDFVKEYSGSAFKPNIVEVSSYGIHS